MQLTIPSLGVNTTISGSLNLVSHLDGPTDGLSYVVMGEWQTFQQSQLQSATSYLFGYETPQTAMPVSGTAVFSGTAVAPIYKTVGSEVQASYVQGNAALSVNFGSGAVAGSFTKMQTLNNQPWNDVSVTATIATGSNRFSGGTSVTSAPGTTFTLAGSATGRIDGAFYGPAAQNLGAVWTLSDGTGSALGTVVAGH